MLSGGEKVRLALAKIFKKKPNVLILDEPTNHMDIVGKETLESMLVDFPGTVIFVSHDRYFVKKVSTKLLLMDEKSVKWYEFGYDQYEQEVEALNAEDDALKDVTRGKVISDTLAQSRGVSDLLSEESAKSARQSYMEGKERAKLEKRKKKLEEEIERIEQEIDRKKEELEDPANASDYVKLQDVQDEIDKLEEQLLELMTEWSS
jgi:ATP-binding cassette subfamily F protein 3